MGRSKYLFLQFLQKLGISRVIAAMQRNTVTILMLHGVTDPSAMASWKPLRSQLTSDQLTSILAVLSRYYRFVSLPEATEMLEGKRPLVSNSLALTFDDGYRNNLTFALPVLRQFRAPATIFLSTGNVTEQKPFWFDRLDYAIQAVENDKEFHYKIPELANIDFSSREALSRSFISFIRKEKQRYATDQAMRAAMEGLAERLEQHFGHGIAEVFADDPWSGVLTWDEVRQAATEVYFGSHGVNHPLLTLVPPDVARRELIDSREVIEFHAGRPCSHLAYPNGSFDHQVARIAKACGYSSAVTIIPGLNRSGDDLMTLRRITFPRMHMQAGIIASVSGLSIFWQKLIKKNHEI